MTRRSLRGWLWVHKWASLVCTLFLLIICVSGLPLVLKDELEDLLDGGLPYAQVPAETPNVSLDRLAARSRTMYPGETILSIFSDDDEPKIGPMLKQRGLVQDSAAKLTPCSRTPTHCL